MHQVWRGPGHRDGRLMLVLPGLGLVLIAAVVAAGSWRDTRRVRASVVAAGEALQRVGADASALQSSDGRAAAVQSIDAALASLRQAGKDLGGSAALSVAGTLPGVRRQRQGLVRLVADVEQAASATRSLLVRLEELAPAARMAGGTISLDGLRSLEEATRRAAGELAPLTHRGRRLWGELGRARSRFDDAIKPAVDRLNSGADALRAARGFLGEERDRRYLVAVQNNAEMRDQGMVLSYVTVSFTGGRVTFGRDGSVDELALATGVATVLPQGTLAIFGSLEPTRLWQSVNATADFPLSGQIMSDMYRQATGEHVDGVIAIDVPGLAALLRVVGPVAIPGVEEPISAENAARVLLHDLYQGLPPLIDDPARARALSRLTRTVIDRLTTGDRDALALSRELGAVAGGGHLRLWSTASAEEEVFQRIGLGGGPGTIDPARTFHLAVQNRTATKLDYYVKPRVRQEIELADTGSATVRTTVIVENQAPADGRPSFQLGPDDFMTGPGEYVGWVILWGPAGSTHSGSTSLPESGLTLAQRVLVVEPGRTRQLTFETVIPQAVRDGRVDLRLVPQPRLEPVPLEISITGPGWRFTGEQTWSGSWDRVVTLSWPVKR